MPGSPAIWRSDPTRCSPHGPGLPDRVGPVTLAPALYADKPEAPALLTAVGTLHAHGAGHGDLAALFDPVAARHAAAALELPGYAFRPRRHWVDGVAATPPRHRTPPCLRPRTTPTPRPP
ncbi:hypothetical protein NKH77_53940 [Streptomyces sp. M19]